jgi:hypothetical protein
LLGILTHCELVLLAPHPGSVGWLNAMIGLSGLVGGAVAGRQSCAWRAWAAASF